MTDRPVNPITRADQVADDGSLTKSITGPPFLRENELNEFAAKLARIQGPYTFFIDAEWGSGKTFFVRELQLMLEAMNPKLVELSKSHDEEDGLDRPSEHTACLESIRDYLQSDKGSRQYPTFASDSATSAALAGYVPVYYNAWDSDYWDDPIPTLLAAMASYSTGIDAESISEEPSDEGSVEVIPKGAKRLAGKASRVLGIIPDPTLRLLSDVLGLIAHESKGPSEAKNLIEEYHQRNVVRSQIRQLIGELLDDKGQRMLLIVDELDRCKPTFALSLLEELKNLFDSDRLTVLYATNMSQLAHTVEGVYGNGFEGDRYLQRFADDTMPLARIYPSDYLRQRLGGVAPSVFVDTALEVADDLGMDLRSSDRYLQALLEADGRIKEIERSEWTQRGNDIVRYGNDIWKVAKSWILPCVIGLGCMGKESYREVIFSCVPDSVCDCYSDDPQVRALLSDTATEVTQRALKNKPHANSAERQRYVADSKSLVSNLVTVMWGHGGALMAAKDKLALADQQVRDLQRLAAVAEFA